MLVIVSGRSGSGKSVGLRALEDMGFYCVDNIPIELLPNLIDELAQTTVGLAISIDIRNLPERPERIGQILDALPSAHKPLFLFLDTDKQTLIRRYSDTRRIHPLSPKTSSLEEAINKENEHLAPLRLRSDLIINTSHLSSHELAEILREKILGKKNRDLVIIFKSFGFKYGLPSDADYVFDTRFLPNPHWVPELRPLTGQDQPIIDYFCAQPIVTDFIYQTRNYLAHWLPLLESNNRSYLTIAIGCTGGRHRSVFVTEQLADYFLLQGKNVQINHDGLAD